ncbi:MAG: antibiotic biosynthesis monooxygenase [Acidobacteria bacterium]|nr:antibiotic biosynthesis monooxygenase [Acidobacteriota bacterium]
MVVLVVSWIAKPGKEEEVAGLFHKLQEESRREPGCLLYVAQRHQQEPARFLVYEQYQDDAALEAHRSTRHFLEIARGELPKIANRVDANLYTPLD